VSRRLVVAGVCALLALAAAAVAATILASAASYTTGSATDVTASADTASNWLHAFSQGTDPDGLSGYALRRVQVPPASLCASGSDAALVVDMGGFPDKNSTFPFNRVFTIRTPAVFPDPAVTAVTATVTLLADPATGAQPLKSAKMSVVGATGGSATVTLRADQKRQLNVQVRARKQFDVGRTYFPVVRVSLSFSGASLPSGYYRYEFPVAVTDAGW